VLLIVLPTVPGAVVVVTTTSTAFGLFNVVAVSLRQRLVPGNLLGRITATWRTVVYGGAGRSSVGGGWTRRSCSAVSSDCSPPWHG
jgi:hypothetical protein